MQYYHIVTIYPITFITSIATHQQVWSTVHPAAPSFSSFTCHRLPPESVPGHHTTQPGSQVTGRIIPQAQSQLRTQITTLHSHNSHDTMSHQLNMTPSHAHIVHCYTHTHTHTRAFLFPHSLLTDRQRRSSVTPEVLAQVC